MLRRVIPGVVVVAVGLGFGGCANETPLTTSLTSVSVLSPQPQPQAQTLPQAGFQPGQLPKKTMSDKVLTAIALERVTGLKPDPGRLVP